MSGPHAPQALVHRRHGALVKAALRPGADEPRALLPAGATARVLEAPSGCGPWPAPDDPGVALGVYHTPGSGSARLLAVSVEGAGLVVRSAEVRGLDPRRPHTLHPRAGGLGVRDGLGGYHRAVPRGPGEAALPSHLFEDVAPPGDPMTRWRRESVSPDGLSVAALEDGETQDLLWRWRVGAPAARRAATEAPVPAVEERAASMLRLFDPQAVAWSPDGRWLAVADSRGVLILEGERPVRRLLHLGATCVSWSADGRLASGSSDRTVRVWEPASPRPLRHTLEGHGDWVRAVSWSSDGRLASGSDDRTVRVWEPASPRPLRHTLEGHGAWVTAVSWSSDGRLASGSDDRTVRVWEPASPRPLRHTLEGHGSGVSAVSWSSDGRLASGSYDRTVRVWEPASPRPLRHTLEGHGAWVTAVSWSSDGRLASGSDDRTVRVWEPASPRPLRHTLEGHGSGVRAVSWSSDGRLASGSSDRTVRVWEPASPRPLRHTLEGHGAWVLSVSWSSDGLLASGSGDRTVRVWDPASPRPLRHTLEGHGAWVLSVSWSSDGRLASGSDDRTVRVWEPASPRPLRHTLEGHGSGVRAVSWSSDGRLASGSSDRTVRVWEPASPRPLRHTLEGHGAWVLSVSWSSDGLLASGSGDRTVRVWEPASPRPLRHTLEGHGDWVRAVSWSSDGRLASGSDDRTVRVWEPASPRPLRHTLEGHGAWVTAVSWSSDGRLASGSYDRTVRVWGAEGAVVAWRCPTAGESGALSWSPEGLLAVASGPEPLLWSVGADAARLWLPLPSPLRWVGGEVQVASPEQLDQAPLDVLDLLRHTDWAAVMPVRDGIYGAGDGLRGLDRATVVAGRIVARSQGWLHLWVGDAPSVAGWTGSVAATDALVRWTPRPGGSQLQGAHLREVEVGLDPLEPLDVAPPEPADDTLPPLTFQGGLIFNGSTPLARLDPPTACARLPDGGWLLADATGALALVRRDRALALRLQLSSVAPAEAVTGLAIRAAAPSLDPWLPWEALVWRRGQETPLRVLLPRLLEAAGAGAGGAFEVKIGGVFPRLSDGDHPAG